MFRKKRIVPGVNSSSTADIAFLLLIFFLMTSSMGFDKGLARRLPPAVDEMTEPTEVKERNVLQLALESDGRLRCGEDYISIDHVRERVKEFVANPHGDETMPEKFLEEIPSLGKMLVTKSHVISFYCDRNVSYKDYIAVQNELVAAYNELRDELAQEKLHRNYAELNIEQQQAIRTVYPQRISETQVPLK